MSRLSELIRDLCPDGVEYRPLGEVAELQRGSGMPKALFREKGVKAIHYGHIYTTYGVHIRDTIVAVDAHAAKKLTTVHPGDLVVANTSENLGDVGSAVAWLGDVDAVTGGHATVIRSTMDSRFLSYYFRTPQFYYEKRRFANGTKVIELSAAKLARIRIPVPPLEVQQEIVRILDQFTTLEAELEAELEARRKQYEHYRDSLLSFHPGDRSVRWVSIGDASDVFGGLTGKRKGDFGVGDARYASYRNVYSNIALDVDPEDRVRICPDENQRRLLLGDLVLTGSSESRDEVGMSSVVVDQPPHDLYLNSFCIGVRWRDPEAYYPDFVKHLFRSGAMRKLISCSADGVTRFNLSKRKLKKLVIPVPLIEEQRRIADILDRFDALVNDISFGLPAELEARRKQYEHYRDRLLLFPEKEA